MNKLARRQAALLAMCCLGCMTAVAADAPVYDIGDIVVTATRTQNATKEVPAATQVIDGENIRQSGATNIREALSYFTNIMQTRIAHGGHDVMIRGMDTNKSLILVDGRKPANESSSASLGTARAMERINLQQVERIEILRGPSSALYGSDAMGGVINIITKKSTSPSGSIGGEYASTGHTQWVHYDTGRQGKLAATVGARLRHTDRDTIEGEQWSEYFGNDQTYNLALDYYFADANKLTFTADYYHEKLSSDAQNPELRPLRVMTERGPLTGMAQIEGGRDSKSEQQTYGLRWQRTTAVNDWEVSAYMSRFDWEDATDPKVIKTVPGSKPLEKRAYDAVVRKQNAYDFNDNTNREWTLEGKNSTQLTDNQRLTYGVTYTDAKVKGTNLGIAGEKQHHVSQNGTNKVASERSLATYAAYVQDEIRADKWFIVPALRYDHNEYFGGHVSPKLGVTYNARDNFRIKANYGKGFRAPSLMQLFYDMDRRMGPKWVHLLGNPDLKPETSTGWDLGVEGEWDRGYGSLTYFDNKVDDLIDSSKVGTDQNGHELYRYNNVKKARIKGVENTLGYRFNDTLSAQVVSTWLDAKDTTANKDLPRRSELSQAWQLRYDDHQDTGWSAALSLQCEHNYLVEPAPKQAATEKKSYQLWNLTVTRQFNPDLRLWGKIENIGDKYDKNLGLYGREWALGLEYKF